MALLFIGLVLGLIVGVRVGRSYALRKLGRYELQQREANIKKVHYYWW